VPVSGEPEQRHASELDGASSRRLQFLVELDTGLRPRGSATVTESSDTARLRLLYDLGRTFAAHMELEDLLPLVTSRCREALDAEGVSVLLLDLDKDELYFPYVAEDDPVVAGRLLGLRFPADRGIAGAALQSGRSIRVDDAQSDFRFYGGVDRHTGATTRALLAVPLVSPQGTVGVLQAVNRRGGGTFSDADLAFLEALSASVAVAIENARLYSRVKESEERLRTQVGALRRDLAQRDRFTEIVGTSASMAEVFRLMESAAGSPIAVLIEGETGTGKELVARGIHGASARGEGPFLAVNCAAVPETLLESELFGHRRGSFTGAVQDRRGLFEAAAGGTVLLDEIGEMPASMQAKLLRVLQEGEVVALGDTRPRRIDARVMSATNRDLSAEITARRFREDLFYRLAAFPIRIPPLRDRREDVPLLADHFLAAAAERHRKWIRGIDPAALDLLVRFDWPGNVRELSNEIERAVALARNDETLGIEQLSPKIRAAQSAAAPGPEATRSSPAPLTNAGGSDDAPLEPLRQARAAFESRYVSAALARHNGNVSQTARALGISRVMLQKKIKALGLR
jgi:Nif-specific regulatory protein